MNNRIFISLYLDERRTKANGKFPLKIRVFTKSPRKQKLYTTNYQFTKDEYEQINSSKRHSKEQKSIKMKLNDLEAHVHKIAVEMEPFSFETLERVLGASDAIQSKLVYHFKLVNENLMKRDAIGTAGSYNQSLNSLTYFFTKKKNRKIETVEVNEITTNLLIEYQQYMITELERSQTTVGIYLRALRTVLNLAIDITKVMKRENYPFGKNAFRIAAPRSVKKALNTLELETLFKAKTKNTEQEKAKDFWFFSYFSNGMNAADIVQLRYSDIKGNNLSFVRKKTVHTNLNSSPIEVFLNDFQKNVIKKYGNSSRDKKDFIFNILDEKDGLEEKYRKRKNFIRFLNQHMKTFAVQNGITSDISTYYARHSFSTQVIRGNNSIEFVQAALGHKNSATTQAYFAGFESAKVKDVNQALLKQLSSKKKSTKKSK